MPIKFKDFEKIKVLFTELDSKNDAYVNDVMKFLGKNEEINVKTKKPEFLDWKWINISELPNIAVDFKVNIYLQARE